MRLFVPLTKLRLFGKFTRSFPSVFHCGSYSITSVESSNKVEFANLEHRKIVSLEGKDTTSFLQGIVTNDVTLLPEMNCMYSMILNQHGRILHDIMLYQPKGGNPDQVLMECEKESLTAITKMLKLYKLRKKFTITPREDLSVIQMFCDAQTDYKDITFGDVLVSGVDPRVPEFGHRVLVENLPQSGEHVEMDIGEYQRRRYVAGIPEGPIDLPPGNCLPLECNLDYMNGVSFHKGCYIGQELTARTKFTGVIRKRLVPFTTTSRGEIEPGETIYNAKRRSAGKFRSLHPDGGIGLALVRLNNVEETLRSKSGEFELKCDIPTWWPFKDGTEFSDGVCGPNNFEEAT